MHKSRWLLIAALVAQIASCNLAAAAALDVDVTHLRPTRTVTVLVFCDAESWSDATTPIAMRQFAARGTTQTLRIDGLPPGRCAVHVEQATNDSAIELPDFSHERHGYSGNASRDRRPSFERAAVRVGADGARVPVHLFTSEQR